jgi:peroxiredoxin Q/BCP
MKPVSVGDKAPDFELASESGKAVRLSDFHARPVVLFFYPKDGTAICTKEACAFRDSHEAFKELGAEVIGISSDLVDSHERFARENNLGYTLLSDTGGKVRKLYGVAKTFGIVPGRVTYVIDREGVIRHVFSSQVNAEKHVEEALRVLGDIAASGNDTNRGK